MKALYNCFDWETLEENCNIFEFKNKKQSKRYGGRLLKNLLDTFEVEFIKRYPQERRWKTNHITAYKQILSLLSTIHDGRNRNIPIFYRYKSSICSESIIRLVNRQVFSERYSYLIEVINRKQRKNKHEILEHKILERQEEKENLTFVNTHPSVLIIR